MPLSIGTNLRVTGHCNQGGRKYMEDMFSVAFQSTPDDKDLEYAFFGIFDGHGGGEAASFAKDHLMNVIVKQKNFWSDRDEDVLRAIRDGYVSTHYAMWRELDKWPRTASGLPSTAGTTASIAFIRKGKIYIGHVGDSGIILGYQVEGDPQWRAKALTRDHKPESGPEMIRIRESGGKVISKSGVPRVVWNRPRLGHKGPVRRSTHIDEIPFLAVARSLGDLWSYNYELDTFVVSPEPDVKVVTIDVKSHRCLIFGTDGLWNMLTPQAAVSIAQAADRHNEKHLIAEQTCNGQTDNVQLWINPSKSLVDRALEKWSLKRLRADNTSVVTLMLDPPGPSRNEVLLRQKECVLTHQRIHTPVPLPMQIVDKYNLSEPRNEFPLLISEYNYDKIQCLPTQKLQEDQKKNPSKEEDKSETEDTVHHESFAEISAANTSTCEIPEADIKTECKEESEKIEAMIGEQSETKPSIIENHQEIRKIDTEDKSDANVSNVIRQSTFPSERDVSSKVESNGVGDEKKTSVLNNLRRRQTPLFSSFRTTESRSVRIRHSLAACTRNSGPETSLENNNVSTNTYVNSRLKLRSTKLDNDRNTDVGTKRRHSAITQTPAVVNAAEETSRVLQEPCVKRRTRSEDRPNPVDENDPANQKGAGTSLSWPNTETNIARSTSGATIVPVQERLTVNNGFQRNLGKKATPVKTIRRSSIVEWLTKKPWWSSSLSARENRSSNCGERRLKRTVSLLGSAEAASVPQRWLRSDTIAATPVKTLRSRNVDITGHTISAQLVHQYGIVRQTRLSLPNKLQKQSGNNGFLQSSKVRSTSLSSSMKQSSSNTGNGGCSTINPTNASCNQSSGMTKRVKLPYNPSARSLSTRSRIKRLGK